MTPEQLKRVESYVRGIDLVGGSQFGDSIRALLDDYNRCREALEKCSFAIDGLLIACGIPEYSVLDSDEANDARAADRLARAALAASPKDKP